MDSQRAHLRQVPQYPPAGVRASASGRPEPAAHKRARRWTWGRARDAGRWRLRTVAAVRSSGGAPRAVGLGGRCRLGALIGHTRDRRGAWCDARDCGATIQKELIHIHFIYKLVIMGIRVIIAALIFSILFLYTALYFVYNFLIKIQLIMKRFLNDTPAQINCTNSV